MIFNLFPVIAIFLVILVTAEIEFNPFQDRSLKLAGETINFAIDSNRIKSGNIPRSGLIVALFKYTPIIFDWPVAKVHLSQGQTTGSIVIPQNAKSGKYLLKVFAKNRFLLYSEKAKSEKFKVLSTGNRVTRFSSFRRIKGVTVGPHNIVELQIASGLKSKDAQKLFVRVLHANNGAVKQTFKNIGKGKETSIDLQLDSFESDVFVEVYAGDNRLVYRSPRLKAPQSKYQEAEMKQVKSRKVSFDNQDDCKKCETCKLINCSKCGDQFECQTCSKDECPSCEACRISHAMVSGIINNQIQREDSKESLSKKMESSTNEDQENIGPIHHVGTRAEAVKDELDQTKKTQSLPDDTPPSPREDKIEMGSESQGLRRSNSIGARAEAVKYELDQTKKTQSLPDYTQPPRVSESVKDTEYPGLPARARELLSDIDHEIEKLSNLEEKILEKYDKDIDKDLKEGEA